KQARRWLESWQREDGSFPAHIRADEAGLAMTATCVAGMRACGASEGDASYARGLAYLQRNGGFAAVDPGTRLLAAIAGLYDPDELKGNYLAYFAIPGVLKLLVRRFNPGAIMFMMALGSVTAWLRHHRKGRRLSLMYRWVRGKLVRF